MPRVRVPEAASGLARVAAGSMVRRGCAGSGRAVATVAAPRALEVAEAAAGVPGAEGSGSRGHRGHGHAWGASRAFWKHVIEGSGGGWRSVGGRERVERWWEVGTMKPAEVFPGLLWLFYLKNKQLGQNSKIISERIQNNDSKDDPKS